MKQILTEGLAIGNKYVVTYLADDRLSLLGVEPLEPHDLLFVIDIDLFIH